MRSLLLLALVAGCASKPDPRVAELEKELADVKARLAAVEAQARPVRVPEEIQGNDEVRALIALARRGNGKAAARLGEIYDKGLLGVKKDFAESLKWYNAARILGEDVPMAKQR